MSTDSTHTHIAPAHDQDKGPEQPTDTVQQDREEGEMKWNKKNAKQRKLKRICLVSSPPGRCVCICVCIYVYVCVHSLSTVCR
jgi:hypothetical protein